MNTIIEMIMWAALAYGTYALLAAYIGIVVQLERERKEKEEH